MKNLSIAGGFLVLAVHGPGLLSLDAWRRRRKQKQKIFFWLIPTTSASR